MQKLFRLLLVLSTLCSLSLPHTATAQTPRATTLAKICIDALHARRVADSLSALPDCRREALLWRHIADSTQVVADDYRKASLLNLDAKRAAEAAEQGEHSKYISSAIEANDFKRKAHHRTVIIVVLALWNIATAGYIVTH